MIDLHSHTTASDGEHAPAELMRLAHAAKVTTLAVTDHDTVAGLAACREAAGTLGMTLVNGIEITAFLNRREVHVLGHFVDPTEARLASFAAKLKVERENRMVQMVEKMKGLGFPVTMEQVRALAGDDAHLARPHLARVLVELGFCTSTKEAFHRFLADGRPGAVPRFELAAADAVAIIRGAGGAATLAHPGVSKIEAHDLAALKTAGLAGVEVEHSDHPPSLREKLRKIAVELDLVPTSGSDFHGAKVAPNRHLGSASMKLVDLERLHARAG
ncbi:MAG: PHP domain-containing protein [Myxococcaceae bacterium]|nr:PHP domain-containing protein [Myxococcaceae bacterium]